MKRLILFCLAASLSAWTPAKAQTLELRASHHSPGLLSIDVGDTVTIEVWTRLDCLEVSGIDMHLSLPEGAFELIDQEALSAGVQPFSSGELFGGAVQVHNGISDLPSEVADNRLHFRFAALTGLGSSRSLKGDGKVASFAMVSRTRIDQEQLRIEDTPILETRLVLPDGRTERRFVAVEGLALTAELPSTAAGTATVSREVSWAEVKTPATD
ncbi:MAG: hypothetical protein HN712_02240 [Gemmatimonadetes bacterium]|mgnify:FL=1|jgi:hypothetical protein|nr:hypothetical protein [Gemmatimonadota bacterium]MBT6146710.1 hypothetical protein [Gemmatimonadota bacterium]MBT7859095.1 hypothetical protein [Gemmatimonadota bacterium]